MSHSSSLTKLSGENIVNLRVLVVDDNINVQRLIGDVLRAAGVGQLKTASDGFSAQSMLSAFDPHVIFSDWNMPVLGGLELTRSIRRAAVFPDRRIPNPQVPVILVTSNRSEGDVSDARAAGVTEFVIKPFTPAALISRMQLVLAKPRPFVVSADYIGPDRRRRADPGYSGPLRRASDPKEAIEPVDRTAVRETISVELEALRGLIAMRGIDDDTLKMSNRVMQRINFQAAQVCDRLVQQASIELMEYIDAMGGSEHCESEILDAHFHAISRLLQIELDRAEDGVALLAQLSAVVKRKIAARRAALSTTDHLEHPTLTR